MFFGFIVQKNLTMNLSVENIML